MTKLHQVSASPEASEWTRPRATTLRLYLLASVVVVFLAASSAPTPLYSRYQREWGFGPLTTTVVFGVYAIAVLLALLVLGRISDHVGRRPVIMTAIAGQVVTLILFMAAGDVDTLVCARVIQGISTGAAIGAIGAGLVDLDRDRGTLLNAIAPGSGTALGAVVSAAFVQYLPSPARLIYVALIACLIAQFVGVALMGEPAVRTRVSLAKSLRPEIRLPKLLRLPIIVATPVLIAVWALAGFYASLGPALILNVARSSSVLLGSLGLFTLAGVAVVAGVALSRQPAGRTMMVGVAALAVGSALTTVSIAERSTLMLFIGAAVAGVGFGAGLQGSFRTVVPLAMPQDRAGVLSVLWILAYLGLGVPAVLAGAQVAHGEGLIGTAERYNIAVIVLAGLALTALLLQRGRMRRPHA
jgi:MFS family permease